ncbi:hypothetical protein B0J17DRAFT_703892 [Rhizoctonia solani]|nr:hypothetical protein B0J17DRAFT_703892 [Rhizoctonia solani]
MVWIYLGRPAISDSHRQDRDPLSGSNPNPPQHIGFKPEHAATRHNKSRAWWMTRLAYQHGHRAILVGGFYFLGLALPDPETPSGVSVALQLCHAGRAGRTPTGKIGKNLRRLPAPKNFRQTIPGIYGSNDPRHLPGTTHHQINHYRRRTLATAHAEGGRRVRISEPGRIAGSTYQRGNRSLASQKRREPEGGALPKKRRPRIFWALHNLPNRACILMFCPLSANPARREQRVRPRHRPVRSPPLGHVGNPPRGALKRLMVLGLPRVFRAHGVVIAERVYRRSRVWMDKQRAQIRLPAPVGIRKLDCSSCLHKPSFLAQWKRAGLIPLRNGLSPRGPRIETERSYFFCLFARERINAVKPRSR